MGKQSNTGEQKHGLLKLLQVNEQRVLNSYYDISFLREEEQPYPPLISTGRYCCSAALPALARPSSRGSSDCVLASPGFK